MPTKAHCTAALIWLACVIAGALVLLLSSCTPLQRLDQAMWGTPAQTYTVTAPDGTVKTLVTEPARPGLIDALATLLAAFGFTGTALWIRRVRNQANGNLDEITRRIEDLEANTIRVSPQPPSLN